MVNITLKSVLIEIGKHIKHINLYREDGFECIRFSRELNTTDTIYSFIMYNGLINSDKPYVKIVIVKKIFGWDEVSIKRCDTNHS